MPDWTKSMQQTYEYYTVDPGTWEDKNKISTVKSCSISYDDNSDTLGSASFEITGDIGEQYIRPYLVTNQNGIIERFPLGTFLAQTPSTSFNGKSQSVSLDAYTPLIELKENQPPLGYSLQKGEVIMDNAYSVISSHLRAPVVKSNNTSKLTGDFVANADDTWLTYSSDLIKNAGYSFDLDPMGRILFRPIIDTTVLQPKYIFDDGNSSILLPDVTINRDLYGIPNAVEVICSSGKHISHSKVVNSSKNSPISTVNRGREIVYRVTKPSLIGVPSQDEIDEYAKKVLRSLSTLEYTISYKHGYYPVHIGDCVILNYEKAGIINQKVKIISQSIDCKPGTLVTEKAVYTDSLWR